MARDVATFFNHPDDLILVPDRPSRSALPAAVMVRAGVGAEDYMLNRFLTDSSSPTGADRSPPSRGGAGTASIKTLQHFLLQLTSVELALQSWKERLLEFSVDGEGRAVDKAGLAAALQSIGSTCKPNEVSQVGIETWCNG